MTARTRLKRKEVDDVLGGEEMWKDADQTESMHCVLYNIVQYMTRLQSNATSAIQTARTINSFRFVQQMNQ